tara:strand:+ start:263 stop:574 length:312 start_codon:yes stop_codon:yes gene_type:complete
MSSSEYLQRLIESKHDKTILEASTEAGAALRDAEDSGEDTKFLKKKAVAEFRTKHAKSKKKKKRDLALIKQHGKRAARARGFGTNYNAKPYANAVRKPKANLK